MNVHSPPVAEFLHFSVLKSTCIAEGRVLHYHVPFEVAHISFSFCSSGFAFKVAGVKSAEAPTVLRVFSFSLIRSFRDLRQQFYFCPAFASSRTELSAER
jgi:hypothetical protein